MTVAVPQEKTALQIQQYKAFTEDPVFKQAITSLSKEGDAWQCILKPDCDGSGSTKTMDTVFFHNDRFEIVLNVRGYKLQDLKCLLIQTVIHVSGKRQQAFDESQKTLFLSRTYELPKPVDVEQTNCCLSAEGILLITAPWSK